MKDEIENVYKDAKFELVAGSGGNFIVEVDGVKIFSKNELERPRFPDSGEILSLIQSLK